MRGQADEHRKQKQGLVWTICSARHEKKIESLKKTSHERGIEDAALPLKIRGSTDERIEALWDYSSFQLTQSIRSLPDEGAAVVISSA
jgi:hypothetical protein